MVEVVDVTGEGRHDGIERAVAALRRGKVVALPTDTRYGLAADAFSINGTDRLRRIAGRDRSVPLPVVVRSPKQLAGLISVVPPAAEHLMAAFWPGPLTLVLASEPSLKWDLGRAQGTVTVRMPLDDVALAVIRGLGPLALTGACHPEGEPATTAEQTAQDFGEELAVCLDDGPRERGALSTIVDLTRREPQVLREGALDTEAVLAVARGELDPAEAPPTEE